MFINDLLRKDFLRQEVRRISMEKPDSIIQKLTNSKEHHKVPKKQTNKN